MSRPYPPVSVSSARYQSWLALKMAGGVRRENQILISVYLIGRGKHVSSGVTVELFFTHMTSLFITKFNSPVIIMADIDFTPEDKNSNV